MHDEERAKMLSYYLNYEQSAYRNHHLAMLGQLAAGMVHEIRNPLTIIRGFLQLLQPEFKQLEKENHVNLLLNEIDHANDLIVQFLNSASPEKLQKQIVNIHSLLEETQLLFKSEALLCNTNIILNMSDITKTLTLELDEAKFKQVLSNIVKNAFEAIKEQDSQHEGRIEITATHHESYITIEVKDNGKGIPKEMIGNLFTPFFTTKETGTGMGLFICQQIIHSHKGFFKVKSTPNVGTTFFIHLPLNT